MADGFSVNHLSVQQVTDDLRTETRNVSTTIETLAEKMNSVDATLEGDTAVNFNDAIARWRLNVEDMKTLLSKAQLALNQIGENYKTTDAREGAVWRALQ